MEEVVSGRTLENKMSQVQLKHKNMYQVIGILNDAVDKIRIANAMILKWNSRNDARLAMTDEAVRCIRMAQESLQKEYFQ